MTFDTYRNHWVVKNVERAPCRSCGRVHPYYTQRCVPFVMPDHVKFDSYPMANMVKLPWWRRIFTTPQYMSCHTPAR